MNENRPTSMTIGTWNCRMGFDRKASAARSLGCDLLVVPECHQTPRIAQVPGVAFEWKGRYVRKGLGVFAFGGWSIERIETRDTLPWVLPCRMIDPAGVDAGLLLAIWTVANHAEAWPSYAAQVSEAIEEWKNELRTDRVVMAGDLNCSLQGPSSAPHLRNLRRLEQLGAFSAYHHHTAATHGDEAHMTLRWIGPGRVPYTYHCDLILLSEPLIGRLETVEVGSFETWIESGLSDHVPVTVRLN